MYPHHRMTECYIVRHRPFMLSVLTEAGRLALVSHSGRSSCPGSTLATRTSRIECCRSANFKAVRVGLLARNTVCSAQLPSRQRGAQHSVSMPDIHAVACYACEAFQARFASGPGEEQPAGRSRCAARAGAPGHQGQALCVRSVRGAPPAAQLTSPTYACSGIIQAQPRRLSSPCGGYTLRAPKRRTAGRSCSASTSAGSGATRREALQRLTLRTRSPGAPTSWKTGTSTCKAVKAPGGGALTCRRARRWPGRSGGFSQVPCQGLTWYAAAGAQEAAAPEPPAEQDDSFVTVLPEAAAKRQKRCRAQAAGTGCVEALNVVHPGRALLH
jgi:hypothetical protein